MGLTTFKERFVALVCACAMVGFGGSVLADDGDDDDDNDEQRTYFVLLQMNGPLVQMGDIEVEQRCENEAEFVMLNAQTCNQVVNLGQ